MSDDDRDQDASPGTAGATNTGDTRAKDAVVDPAMRAEIERWFSMPSAIELVERRRKEDRELLAAQKREAAATAAVEEWLLADLERRRPSEDDLIQLDVAAMEQFRSTIDLTIVGVDPDARMARGIPLPRQVEIPWQLTEDLEQRVPQALLRDLYRPVLDFHKVYEVSPEHTIDVVEARAIAQTAMASHFELPALEATFSDACGELADARAFRRRSWVEILTGVELPDRTNPEPIGAV